MISNHHRYRKHRICESYRTIPNAEWGKDLKDKPSEKYGVNSLLLTNKGQRHGVKGQRHGVKGQRHGVNSLLLTT
jgi:hypothetical protein